MLTELRKLDHIRICLEQQVETGNPLWQDIALVHQALPELCLDDIDTSCTLLGKKLALPLVITGMTGGCEEAREINRSLAAVAEKAGIGFGVGSQRAMIENPHLVRTYAVRDVAPHVLLLGNIGITALKTYEPARIADAMRAISADAVCVHMNAAQELFQQEGDRDFSGCLDALKNFCCTIEMPVIAKEVGNGISRHCARLLQSAGVSVIDVGGLGGTNWIVVESLRSGVNPGAFRNWGISTALSILECRECLPLIATGGVRTGLDMAKAIALGADVCGIALPFLKILDRQGTEGVEAYIDALKVDFTRAMLLTGCARVNDLRKSVRMLSSVLRDAVGSS